MKSETVKTTCPYCGVGCGVIISRNSVGEIKVKGDPEHPANFGSLCSKGSALADTLSLHGRLLVPEIAGEQASWETAINETATRLKNIIDQHGPDSVAFYVSGQLMTEDYYVANKLMKGFIGSGNIDTNSRLCMSSAVAGHKRAFGSDTVPGCYEDLEKAKLVVLVGSNTAWCHPVVYQRIARARKENPDLYIVVIDPRKTATTQIADLHLPIAAGTDQVLFNGLFKYIDDNEEADEYFIKESTEGFEDIRNSDLPDLESVAEQCELTAEQVESFYKVFSRTERVVTLFSQGINQWSFGTNRVNSIINVHLLTGRIGRTGMGPFSITGQPNAMGGREAGGLANQLAAHMDIANPNHHQLVKDFWKAPSLTEKEGLKAVDLFKEIKNENIKAVWIMATNPAVSLPEAELVREALSACELVIVSDCMKETDTTRYADILLPALTWGERDGTVTNSERCISRQRPFLAEYGEAKPDWWIISEVARSMGFEKEFNYTDSLEIFKEHAALSGYKNNGERDFNISALSDLSREAYDQLNPIQWPVTDKFPNGTKRMFADRKFFTPSGKARFIRATETGPASELSEQYPFALNTGRIRDQWHTMTRSGKSARLSLHISEPFVEIHPEDAEQYGLKAEQLVKVSSMHGESIVKTVISKEQKPGNLFMPIHWNDQFSSNAVVDQLVTAITDPVSGQPEFKWTPVTITPLDASWYGFILSRRDIKLEQFDYWSKTRTEKGYCYHFAGLTDVENWNKAARSLLCNEASSPEWIEYLDAGQKRYRAARIDNNLLDSCIFIGPDAQSPDMGWLKELFNEDRLEDYDRRNILAGKSSVAAAEPGPVICSCFSVGLNTIKLAIEEQQLVSVEQVGELLRAGTNCGSCKPEIQSILDEMTQQPVVLKVVK